MFSKFGRSGESTPAASQSKDEVSLTSILNTPALRAEFVALVAACSDSMRRELLATYECPTDTSVRSSLENSLSQAPNNDLIDIGETKEHLTDFQDFAIREIKEELSLPEVRALRRAALAFFDGWQIKVLRRLGEALNVKSETIRIARAKATRDADATEKRLVAQIDGRRGEAFEQYMVFPTSLTKLDEPKRQFLLNCLLLLLLSLETYPAQSRILLMRFTSCLGLSQSALTNNEAAVAHGLLDTAAKQMSADESVQRQADDNAASRRWKVGLATVGGAALIGITGGLAAPLLVAGVGGVMGALGLGAVASLLGAVASSSVLIGGLFGAYGGRMTGRVMEAYAKEVDDFRFLPITADYGLDDEWWGPAADQENLNLQDEKERERHRLRVAIGITGWLTTESEILSPWRVLSTQSIEPFALRWEVSTLLKLGTSLRTVVQNYLLSGLSYVILRQTVLKTLMMGLWPLTLLSVARVAENPFSIAKARSDKAGKVLAEAIMEKVQGERPVTLLGFSMGARVIWSCLQTLAANNAFGLVENVVMMGTPAPADAQDWRRIRAVVSGRLINVFSKDDWILGALYRGSTVRLGVAGLESVKGVNGVQNYDASELVKGHPRYRFAVGQILQDLQLEDLDEDEVEMERLAWLAQEEEEAQAKEKGIARRKEGDERSRSEGVVLVDRDEPENVPMKKPERSSTASSQQGLTGVVKEEGRKNVVTKQHNVATDSDTDDELSGPIQMLDLDPIPEPDSDRER